MTTNNTARRRSRLAFLAATVASVVALTIPGSPAVASGSSSAAGSAGVALARAAVDQLQVDNAAERIQALSRSPMGAGFAGVVVSGQQHAVTLYWHGVAPPAVSALIARLRADGLTVNVRQAPYTEAQLNARVHDVIARRGDYQRAGIVVNGAFELADGTGVVVNVSTTAPATARALPMVAGDPLNGVATRLVAQPPATPLNRLSDYVPHWAGARIQSSSSSCTSGFPIVRDSDGRTFILTAGHCTGTPWYAPVIPDSTHDYKFGDTWTVTPGLDIQYIRSFVQGQTYDGGVKPGTEISKPVVGTSGNQAGDSVCQSGSWTGIHCGLTIVQHGYININGSFVPGWTACQQSGLLCTGTAGGEGDSGAPVFSLAANPNQVMARGSLSGGLGGTFNCSNNNGETTVCAHEIFFVDIQDILNNYGAHILTS